MSTIKATNLQHASAATPAIVLAADGTAAPVVSSLNSGPLGGFRNAIINGNFDIWQRATSVTTAALAGYATADRWMHNSVGTSTTFSRQSFTLGQTDVPGEPTYYMRAVVSSVTGSTNRSNIQQKIEDVRTYAGREITLSFWAKASASKYIAVEFNQDFGSGGTPSSSVGGIGATKFALTTTWQKYITTLTLPSIVGKTLGTDEDHWTMVNFWFDAGSDFIDRTDSLGHQSGTFDIAQIQLEPGSVATPFERKPVSVELSLCQRYFIGYPLGTTAATLNNIFGIGVNYPVQSGVIGSLYKLSSGNWPVTMRAAPTINYSGTPVYSGCSTLSFAVDTYGYRVNATSTATGPIYATLADGSLSIDAELY